MSLSSLPAELKLTIFHATASLSLKSFFALVSSSKVLYALYTCNKHSLLLHIARDEIQNPLLFRCCLCTAFSACSLIGTCLTGNLEPEALRFFIQETLAGFPTLRITERILRSALSLHTFSPRFLNHVHKKEPREISEGFYPRPRSHEEFFFCMLAHLLFLTTPYYTFIPDSQTGQLITTPGPAPFQGMVLEQDILRLLGVEEAPYFIHPLRVSYPRPFRPHIVMYSDPKKQAVLNEIKAWLEHSGWMDFDDYFWGELVDETKAAPMVVRLRADALDERDQRMIEKCLDEAIQVVRWERDRLEKLGLGDGD